LKKIEKYKFYLFLLIIPSVSLVISIKQAIYNYDGYHWGLILFSAEGLNLGGKPFEDVFIHYGLLSTKLNALILNIFTNNFIFVFTASSLAYAFSIFIQSILILRLTNIYFALLGSLIIFFLHPYANFPWHTYYIFFLFNIFLLLRFSSNHYLKYSSYTLLFCITLFSESFFIASIFIFLFDVFLLFSFKEKINVSKYKVFLIRLFFYIFPLIIFGFYLKLQNLYPAWQVYNGMGKIFLEIIDKNLVEMFFHFFITLKNYSLDKFFVQPNWMIYSVLIIFNLFFLLNFILKNFNKKISENDLILVVISFASLIFLYQAAHSFTIYKFACGLMIGIIVMLNSISKINNKENILIITTILFFYSFSSFGFSKNENNRLYVYNFQKDNNIKSDYFKYFKTQKWEKATWNHLIAIDKNIKNIKDNCNINSGVNLSKDGLVSVIMRNNLDFNQLLPWYENKSDGELNRYYDTLWKSFDSKKLNNISSQIDSKKLMIYTDEVNFPIINLGGKNINIQDKMNFVSLPYSYEHKNRILLFPKNCNNF
jgi:hypothetical protein